MLHYLMRGSTCVLMPRLHNERSYIKEQMEKRPCKMNNAQHKDIFMTGAPVEADGISVHTPAELLLRFWSLGAAGFLLQQL